jgi:hypothetical protein
VNIIVGAAVRAHAGRYPKSSVLLSEIRRVSVRHSQDQSLIAEVLRIADFAPAGDRCGLPVQRMSRSEHLADLLRAGRTIIARSGGRPNSRRGVEPRAVRRKDRIDLGPRMGR